MTLYLYRVAIATDRWFNTVALGRVGETISSRAYRLSGGSRFWSLMQFTLDRVFFWQSEHCRQSYDYDRNNKDFES